MKSTDTEMAQAAYIVSDEITDMKMALERAEIVMQDINEDYFNKYDSHDKDGRVSIAWEYSRHEIKSDIVIQYLHQVRTTLETLYELGRKGMELKAVAADE